MFFTAGDGTHGQELWTSDGTAAGTVLVEDIHPAGYRTFRPTQVAFAGKLFFAAKDRTHGRELWSSDGTQAGTRLVKDIDSGVAGEGPLDLTPSGGTLFFTDDRAPGRELWRSNGSRAGTVKVKVIDPGVHHYTYSSNLTDVGGRLFFAADDSNHGKSSELWTSDGTTSGTRVLKDFGHGSEADVSRLTDVDGRLFFTADGGRQGGGLWTSDGSPAGTVLVKTIGAGHSSKMIEFAGRLFFPAYDTVHGTELWKSDGTEAGTLLVKDINEGPYGSVKSLTTVSGRLFFTADDGIHGRELWTSDGTTAGTTLVKDINPGADKYDSPLDGRAGSLTDVGGRLFFTANDGIHGRELWTSDGTSAGTVMVKDIKPEGRGSDAGSLTDVGGRLFFAANDGIHGRELWTSDGTEAGTVLVEDIKLETRLKVAERGKADTREGTRRVNVRVEAAGRLVVAPARGSLIKTFSADVDAAGKTTVTLEPTAKGMKELERALREARRDGREVGELRVKARFTFTSCAGDASSKTRWYTLKLK